MNIKYEFVTGEVVEIEVSDYIGEVSIEIEREDFNINRKESRRHNSIEVMEEQGNQFKDHKIDIFSEVEEKEISDSLHKALNKLLPQQKELIEEIFIKEKPIVKVAEEHGVTEAAIRNRLKKIYKKLKAFLN